MPATCTEYRRLQSADDGLIQHERTPRGTGNLTCNDYMITWALPAALPGQQSHLKWQCLKPSVT